MRSKGIYSTNSKPDYSAGQKTMLCGQDLTLICSAAFPLQQLEAPMTDGWSDGRMDAQWGPQKGNTIRPLQGTK